MMGECREMRVIVVAIFALNGRGNMLMEFLAAVFGHKFHNTHAQFIMGEVPHLIFNFQHSRVNTIG